MRFFLLILFFLFLTKTSFAQNDSIKKHKIDSLTTKFRNDSLHTYRFKKFRPFGNIDNRNSFIKDKPVNLNGILLGLIYKDYHTFGIGFYKLTDQSQKSHAGKDNNRRITQSLTLSYTTVFYQYVFIDRRYFEIDLPFELGLGNYNITFTDSITKKVYKNLTAPIIPLGAGVQLVLKPVRWIGVSITGGYRYVARKDVNLNFNGFYYSFGVWIDFRQIYRDIKFYGFQKKRYKREVKNILMF